MASSRAAMRRALGVRSCRQPATHAITMKGSAAKAANGVGRKNLISANAPAAAARLIQNGERSSTANSEFSFSRNFIARL